MPDSAVIPFELAGEWLGWRIVAAGIRRERTADGALTADVMLENGQIVFSDRAILNTASGQSQYAQAATGEQRPDAPTIEAALLALVPEALAVVQESAPRPSQADALVELATDAELFHDPSGEPYATIQVDDHQETHRIRTSGFRAWLKRGFHQDNGKTPGNQALQDALGVIEGQAIYDGPTIPVAVRIAGHEDRIYIDLANEQWQVIEIDAEGWRVVDDAPVRFRRARGMSPLPIPESGGSLDTLWEYVNVEHDDRVLISAWLVAALRPTGPYPVGLISGEQGAAKTTAAMVLRALVDPNAAPTRVDPREGRDLMVTATNSWTLIYDNLSRLPDWLSDAFCRLSTGGGFSTRQLYTDDEEMIFEATRPLLLTGIEDVVSRGDLLDRSIQFVLPSIPPHQRKTERQFWEEFERDRPFILGALLDRVSTALAEIDSVRLTELPRMADFAQWAYAAAGPDEGEKFLSAYSQNRESAHEIALDDAPVAGPLRTFIEKRESWSGTASDLLAALTEDIPESTRKLRAWPKTARAISGQIRRLAPHLRAVGIDVAFERTMSARTIQLEYVRKRPSFASLPSCSKNEPENADKSGILPVTGYDANMTQNRHDDANDAGHDDSMTQNGLHTVMAFSPDTSGKQTVHDANDGNDAKLRAYSNQGVCAWCDGPVEAGRRLCRTCTGEAD